MGLPPRRLAAATVLFLAAAAWAAALASYPARGSAPRPRRLRRWRAPRGAAAANQTSFADGSHRRSLRTDIQLERTTYKLPHALEENLFEWSVRPIGGRADLPVFWHILKSGGTTVKLMYAQCYRLVEACETGALVDAELQQQGQVGAPQPAQEQQATLSSEAGKESEHPSPWEWMQQQLMPQEAANDGQRRRLEPMPYETQGEGAQPPENAPLENTNESKLRVVISEDGRKYVNVDVTTPEGIQTASHNGFASSPLADVAFTPLLTESAHALLNHNRKGRMFALFRHPVERVVSIFHYLQKATWEPTYNPAYATMTVDEYARSAFCESNWMVRSLTNKMTGPMDPDDVLVAMEVLKRKCVVGLMDDMDESIVRFHAYFRFGDEGALRCARERFAQQGSGQNTHKHPKLDPKNETWEVLRVKNALDIRLYEYARDLFEEQGKWMRKEMIIV